jgi:predicted transcriptional regulator
MDKEKLAQLRAAYEVGEMPVRKLCAEYGISQQTLYYHARLQGWTKRLNEARPLTPDKLVEQSQKLMDSPAPGEKKLALINAMMQALEQRIFLVTQEGDAMNGEKDARTISALAKTLDTLSQLADKARDELQAQGRDHDTEDLEKLREELERKIDRLAESTASRLSDQSDEA